MFYLFLGQPWTNAYTNQQLAITIQMQASLTSIQSKFSFDFANFAAQIFFQIFTPLFSDRKEDRKKRRKFRRASWSILKSISLAGAKTLSIITVVPEFRVIAQIP
jgi:hypothetical protein